MKVREMLALLEGLDKEDDIYCAFFTKDEADGKGEEDLDQVDFRFENAEWAKIVAKLERDKGISRVSLYHAYCFGLHAIDP